MISFPPSPDHAEFALLDQIACPVFVLEPDDHDIPRYVAFNIHARVISCRPLSDYLGRTAHGVDPTETGRNAHARFCEALRTKKTSVYDLEVPLFGTIRNMRTTLIPQRDRATGNWRLFGTTSDVTAERINREAQFSYDEMTSEMEQFISMAAHDLRAPMRNITLLADMLREDFVDHGDGKLQLIDMMEDVAAKSMALISDVLAHAHATACNDSASRFNVAHLCRDIIAVLDPQGTHIFKYPSAFIQADRTALQIGLRNIIENAIKHGGRGPLTIEITLQNGSDGRLDITMRDNGQGFSNNALAFLNGGAFRMDSGYGLLGVRRMVQSRGGALTAHNAENGQGAVIRFDLPGSCVSETIGPNRTVTTRIEGSISPIQQAVGGN